ncbi:MAG: peptide chain release factor N(5)-glutamine methyltransferase [Sediminibacterium sp.]|jgi:release factor glutamine methyltransferase|nr:peptide chain release factor N(5)-glutamine methyltransferase [Sediminibacterium sp.]
MSLQDTKQAIKHQLGNLYDAIEMNSMVNIIIEEVTGWDALHQNIHKNDALESSQIEQLDHFVEQLLNGKPLQYIIQKAWFLGKAYFVNEAVLIPRPETEELVEWIIEYAQIINKPLSILDIGTGSGCIPISLKLAIPNAHITAIDISKEALAIAEQNAANYHTEIEWIAQDILQTKQLKDRYDIMVSNPPYIPLREKLAMQKQVADHEPEIALFVPDQFPLIFYSKIAHIGKSALKPNGQLFFEIHYDQGEAIIALLNEMGYHAELKQDLFGKDRMVRASLKS